MNVYWHVFSKFLSAIEDGEDRFLFSLLIYYGIHISDCLVRKWTRFKKDGHRIDQSASIKNDTGGVIFITPKTVNSIRVYPIINILRP